MDSGAGKPGSNLLLPPVSCVTLDELLYLSASFTSAGKMGHNSIYFMGLPRRMTGGVRAKCLEQEPANVPLMMVTARTVTAMSTGAGDGAPVCLTAPRGYLPGVASSPTMAIFPIQSSQPSISQTWKQAQRASEHRLTAPQCSQEPNPVCDPKANVLNSATKVRPILQRKQK